MMYHRNCKCPHHRIVEVISGLVWLAGILFFWSALKGVMVWGYDPLFYAWSAVILSLMAFGMKSCGCCGMSAKGMSVSGEGNKTCSHQPDCKCGDCDRCR